MASAGTPSMRAEPWMAVVLIGTCQPSQERAFTPMALRVMARSPQGTCSPAATTTSYSRWSTSARWFSPAPDLAASLVQATSLLVSPDMAETTTATLLPRSTSAFTNPATWRMRGISATEVPPNFIAFNAMARICPGRNGGLCRRGSPLPQPSPNLGAQPSKSMADPASLDPAEVAKFSAIAAEWWDPAGKFAPLHKFSPVRLSFIRTEAASHFGRDGRSLRPFEGFSLLDIGCGGGLLSEPMARLGFAVTGADASERNIGTARAHAAQSGLAIDYRATTAEALLGEGLSFDVVLNKEEIEHVADVTAYLTACTQLLKPGGLTFVATLNKTLKSLALAKIGAEYVLGWLPRGARDWSRFVPPAELKES